jgi:UDP-N-acetylglucosamine--N-acetylmuramyl-(pentapeptide) pyrophosphoryl-undecaprenol N-acetylglucosamine transferase
MKILIAGGGTAGHVFPSLAVAERLAGGGARVEFVGSGDGQEAALIPAAGYPFHPIRAIPFRRELSIRSALAPAVALRSAVACRPFVRDAGVVLGMGGFASIPAVAAARTTRVPVVLHEQNAVPGLANRLLARIATAIGITFEDSRTRLPGHPRIEVTGLPARREILGIQARRDELAEEARRVLGLEPDRTTILVMGGSQGALQVDRAVAGAIPLLADRRDLQLLVLTGPAHEAIVVGPATQEMGLVVRTIPFLERMDLALALADLAVSRAGANTVNELALSGVPSILVPYPHATDAHQEANARELQRIGAAEVLTDRELTPERFAAAAASLAADRDRRAMMGKQAMSWAKPDADERLARLVMMVAGR